METTPTKHKTADDFLTITDVWYLCITHWNWFVVSLLICIGYACYYLAVTPSLYTRSAAVLVKQDAQGKDAGWRNYGEEFNNLGLLQQSTNVANVQRQLTSLNVLTEVVRRAFPGEPERDVVRKAQRIQRRLKTKIDDDKSTIINLTYVDESPQHAEVILNLVVQVYNELWIEDKNQITAAASRFIEERLKLLEDELGVVDDSISAFKVRNKITDLDRVSDIYLQQQSQSDAEILRLTNQKVMAQYILGILQDKANRHQLLPTNSGINNSVAETQIAQYNSMLLQLKNNLYGTSQQNPLIIKQESDLDDMRSNILATIDNQIKALDIQLNALQGYNGEATDKISSNPGQAKHLVSVEREQKVKESLYLYLLQKKEENEINMTYTSFNTQLIDMPHGSDFPTSPNSRNVLLGAILLGLLMPGVILYVRESLDNTVRDKYDIERHSSLPLVGEVPLYTEEPKSLLKRFRLPRWRKPSHPFPLVVRPDRQDLVNEAFRFIRTNLEFMTVTSGSRNVYIVTSQNEGSGKTFVSTNLAIALAIKGHRVLFIDGDLRHASASRALECPKVGLADYLGEKEERLDTLLVPSKNYPTLDILPVGTIPPNPTELLSGSRLGKLIDEVRRRYEFVLIDCPPAESLADTGIIERHADRTLFVVRAGLFIRKHIDDLEADVQNGKYKHLSIVLNATLQGSRYGYRYGYRYGRYYSYHHR